MTTSLRPWPRPTDANQGAYAIPVTEALRQGSPGDIVHREVMQRLQE